MRRPVIDIKLPLYFYSTADTSLTWVQTYSGKKFPIDIPDPAQIDIGDIAHALSMLCRFNGHGRKFYSVAEHSIHVSYEVSENYALAGLLHDAAEAYLGDVPSPLKQYLHDFKRFEKNLEMAVGEHFGIDWRDFGSKEVKRADVQLLMDEKAVLMEKPPQAWLENEPEPKNPERIKCWLPMEAKERFLERYGELVG